MKVTTKIKIWGLVQLSFGITLILLGTVFLKDEDSFGSRMNIAFFIPGIFLSALSFMILLFGFLPQFTRFTAKVRSETLDHAKVDLNTSVSKQANLMAEAVTPAMKKTFGEMQSVKELSLEEKLIEAKRVYDAGLITSEEYMALKKNILGIKE